MGRGREVSTVRTAIAQSGAGVSSAAPEGSDFAAVQATGAAASGSAGMEAVADPVLFAVVPGDDAAEQGDPNEPWG